MNSEPISDLDILAYADGHLDCDPQRKAAVEEAMRASPHLAQRVSDLCAQTRALREAYDPRLAEPVPNRFYTVLQSSGSSGMRMIARAATLVLLVAGSAAAGWFGARMQTTPPDPGAELAELGYTYLDGRTPATVPNRSETISGQAVKPTTWLNNGVSLTLPEPDLKALGFTVTRRDSIMSKRGRILRFDYSNAQGDSFTLFLRPRGHPQKSDVRLSQRGDVSIVHWLDGVIESAVATHLPEDKALDIANSVRQAQQNNQRPSTPDNERLDQAPTALSAENTLLTPLDLNDKAMAEPMELQ
jgi:anti-sigma factor RsiW